MSPDFEDVRGLGPSEGQVQVVEVLEDSSRLLNEGLDRAKEKMNSMIPEIRQLEGSSDVLNLLISSRDELEKLRDTFRSNENESKGTGNEADPHVRSVSVSKQLEELYCHIKSFDDGFRKLLAKQLEVPATANSQSKKKEDEISAELQKLEQFISRLKAWESHDCEGATPTGRKSIQKYIKRLGQSIGEHIENLSDHIVSFSETGCHQVLQHQDRHRQAQSVISGIATIISAVTSAILPTALATVNPSETEGIINAMWFLSLSFSLVATIIGLLDIARLFFITERKMLTSKWITRGLTVTPFLFLVVSIATFQVGLSLLAYTSHQLSVTSSLTTFAAALSLIPLIIFITIPFLWIKMNLKKLKWMQLSWPCLDFFRLKFNDKPEGKRSDPESGPLLADPPLPNEVLARNLPSPITWYDTKCYSTLLSNVNSSKGLQDPPSGNNPGKEQVLTYPVLDLKNQSKETAQEQDSLNFEEMTFSADGIYIGALTKSGDCRVYKGVVNSNSGSANSKNEQIVNMKQPDLPLVAIFRGSQFIRISWFKNSRFALLVAQHSSKSFQYMVYDIHARSSFHLGSKLTHVCHAMLHKQNAFIAVEASESQKETKFVLYKISSDNEKDTSKLILLKLSTLPMHIKTMAITNDDRYLIYTEDSTLSDPKEMWISVIDLKDGKKLFEIPILRTVRNISISRFEDVALIELSGIAPSLWKLNLNDDKKDLMEHVQSYSSPKIKDMSGKSIFCGAEDEWVLNWNSDEVASWWNRRLGSLVRGPIGLEGLRCLDASTDNDNNLKLAVGRKHGRIELWSGKAAEANEVIKPKQDDDSA